MTDIIDILIKEFGEEMVLTGEDVSSRQSGFFARSGVKRKLSLDRGAQKM